MTTKRKNKISGWFRKIPLNIGTFIFGALFVYMVITVILYLTADHIQSYQVTAGAYPIIRHIQHWQSVKNLW